MTDNMREVWDAHDKARNKAWREEPGTFDTLDAFKAGAAWQAAKSVPVVGDVLFFASDSTATSQSQIRYDVCADQKDYSFFPIVRKPTTSITDAELERLRKDAERLRDALRYYGAHSNACDMSRFVSPAGCTCGYDAAIAAEETGNG